MRYVLQFYGSLILYFVSYSLMWMYIEIVDNVEACSFFTRGLISGFVAVLVIIFFNVLLMKPNILKESREVEK